MCFWTDEIHPPSQSRYLTNPQKDNREGIHTGTGNSTAVGHQNKENILTVAGKNDLGRRDRTLSVCWETIAVNLKFHTRGKSPPETRVKQAHFIQQRMSFCYHYNLIQEISKECTWGKRKVIPGSKSEVKEKQTNKQLSLKEDHQYKVIETASRV